LMTSIISQKINKQKRTQTNKPQQPKMKSVHYTLISVWIAAENASAAHGAIFDAPSPAPLTCADESRARGGPISVIVSCVQQCPTASPTDAPTEAPTCAEECRALGGPISVIASCVRLCPTDSPTDAPTGAPHRCANRRAHGGPNRRADFIASHCLYFPNHMRQESQQEVQVQRDWVEAQELHS